MAPCGCCGNKYKKRSTSTRSVTTRARYRLKRVKPTPPAPVVEPTPDKENEG